MTKLNELKEQIELDEIEAGETPEAWGDGVFEMPFSTAKALIEATETAFAMANLWEATNYGGFTGKGTLLDFARLHERMQKLQKELQ